MRGSHGRDDAASIPIFAMSANAFVEDRQAAKEAGMDVHIAKPIDAELLKKKNCRVLQVKRSAPARHLMCAGQGLLMCESYFSSSGYV